MVWKHISDNPPEETELMLWLKAEPGSDTPIGQVIASYKNTSMGAQWCEKSVSGNINTGLRASLITHYRILEDGPDGQRSATEETNTVGSLSFMG